MTASSPAPPRHTDADGKAIQVGDTVLIEAVVVEMRPHADGLNLRLRSKLPLWPWRFTTHLAVGARQVRVVAETAR
jgi:hypothetical protein